MSVVLIPRLSTSNVHIGSLIWVVNSLLVVVAILGAFIISYQILCRIIHVVIALRRRCRGI